MSRRERFSGTPVTDSDDQELSVASGISISSDIHPVVYDDPTPMPINYSTTYSTYTPNVDTSPFITFNLPRRLFRWIYSISLVILSILVLALATPTPIDVIAQTSGTNSPGVKLFIVIIVFVVFLVVALFMYFLRIVQHRIAMNDIPTRSMYVPGEGDLPKSTMQMINKNLKRCVSVVKVKAGPMNSDTVLNHPGLSPPAYVQERNANKFGTNLPGTCFPPDSNYEDVIRSLGDKFRENSTFIYQFHYPKNYSMREIFVHLYETYSNDPGIHSERLPDVAKLIMLYERMKFGSKLISENDLFEFMVEFNKFGILFHHTNEHKAQAPQSEKPLNTSFIDIPTSEADPRYLENYFHGMESDDDTYSHKVRQYYGSESESVDNIPMSKTSSLRSVVKNRLAIGSNTSLEARRYSGYVTDESTV